MSEVRLSGDLLGLPAQPDIRAADADDSPFLAEVILMASRSHLPMGLWDLVVSGDEEARRDFVEFLTLLDVRSFCSYDNFLVAERDGHPVAALAGYDSGEVGLVTPGYLIATGSFEFGWSDAEQVEALGRLEPYQQGVPDQIKGLWTIEWVATLPSQRRRGFIQALLERTLEEGRTRGLRRAQVTTYIGNVGAMTAYKKAGFEIAEEKRHVDFQRLMGAPGLVRYERAL